MDKQKSSGLEVLKTSIFAGLFLFILLIILYFFMMWFINSEYCEEAGLFCLAPIGYFLYVIVPLVWLGSIIFLIKSFKKINIPRIPIIIALGSFTFLFCELLLLILLGYWGLEFEYILFFIIVFILVIYPFIYVGYGWLFNHFLPTIDKKIIRFRTTCQNYFR